VTAPGHDDSLTASTPQRPAAEAQPVLAARHVNKAYPVDGESRVAVADITFEVFKGEFVCVVGPSGAGKTTLLRCLSGLMPPSSGETLFEGRAIDRVPEQLSVVFQDYSRSLFPWSKVARNVELPLKVEGVGKAERRERVEEMLAAVGLATATRGSSPAACSSGSRSPGPWPTGPSCCSWTSRSPRSTPRRGSSSRT
jgi:NitT/TauT family transport system ATP-binding protein